MGRRVIAIRRVRSVISQLLPDGYPTLAAVSAELDVSPRTLQRRLADDNLTHSKLVVQIRLAKACQLLARPDISIRDISREAGFATPSAFSRAFHSWTGDSPRVFRNGH